MDNALLGEIRLFAGNFAPYGWAMCQGQTMQLRQYTALYAIIGTRFGGDGTNTFLLPNLQGSIPVSQGAGPALTPRVVGEAFGTPSTTLTINNLPNHSHAINASSIAGTTNDPTNNIVAARGKGDTDYTSVAPNANMNVLTVGVAGNSQPVSNIQPVLTLSYIIAIDGAIFPVRN